MMAAQNRIPSALIGKFQQVLPALRQWVDDTLYAYRKQAFPVERSDYPRLFQVFPHDLLNRVRCVLVAGQPPFPPLSRMGLPELAASEAMPIAGITYRDTFFVKKGRQNESLYFHEIVHVVQWDRLGVDGFLLAYGMGLMQWGYRDSPLEEMAYRLQSDFDQGRLPAEIMGVIWKETDRIRTNAETLTGPIHHRPPSRSSM
jgi:hypothetical protein